MLNYQRVCTKNHQISNTYGLAGDPPLTHHDHAWAIGVNRIDEPLESPLEGWASHGLASISTQLVEKSEKRISRRNIFIQIHSEYHHSPNRKISGYSVCVCVLFCHNCYRNPNRLWRFHVLKSLLPRLQDRLHLTGGQFPGCIGIKVVKRLPAWNPCDGDRFPIRGRIDWSSIWHILCIIKKNILYMLFCDFTSPQQWGRQLPYP